MSREIARRKDHHLDLCLNAPVEAPGVGALFEHVHLVHDALPELSLDGLDTAAKILGRTLRAPLLVVGMTGGTERARQVNRDLALAAQRRGVAFGVGSQRAMHEDPALAASYEVRDIAPDVLLFGNLGAQQAAAIGVRGVRALLDRIGADGLFIHLNPGQELVQPGGDRDFRGCLEAIRALAGELGPRVWVKETGCGLSRSVARRLVAAGVGGLDVSGAGGTSWTKVEALRAEGSQQALGERFASWGVPTAAAVAGAAGLGVPVVASGGVRSGLDVAKAMALGADIGGMALPYLRAQQAGGAQAVEAAIAQVELELRTAMLLTGSGDVPSLKQVARVLTGPLPSWIETLRGQA